MAELINIFGKLKEEIVEICISESFPIFTAKQICEWIYKKGITSFDDMTNLSLKQRETLAEKYIISPSIPADSKKSKDATIKYLYKVEGNHFVETVVIPDDDRTTVCISTQTACNLACRFCQTGKVGKAENLSVGDIVSQVLFLPEYEKLTNIVIMGMGEPLLNWENVSKAIKIFTSEEYMGISKRRITLSTVGIIPALKEFLQLYPCELAISLHTPFSEKRKEIMPIENKYPIEEIFHLVRRYTSNSSRVVSFEYIVLKNFNDSEADVEELSHLLAGIPCKINLMTFHKVDDFEMESPSRGEMEVFQTLLKQKGFTVTIRKSRGKDIDAACGMLSAKKVES